MKIQEYAAMDAVALAARIRAGELDPIEVTDAAIAAIEDAAALREKRRGRAGA